MFCPSFFGAAHNSKYYSTREPEALLPWIRSQFEVRIGNCKRIGLFLAKMHLGSRELNSPLEKVARKQPCASA